MAYTSGLTKSVRWQFGFSGNKHEHFLDFHVLKNAPAEVILSDSFLFETEAFSQYECYMLDEEDEDFGVDAYFFTISYDPSYRNRGKVFLLEAIVFSLTVPVDSVDMSTIANMEFEE
jgi:hypothetical protein